MWSLTDQEIQPLISTLSDMCAMEVFLEKEIALKTCILIVFFAFFWDTACLLDFSLKDTFIKILVRKIKCVPWLLELLKLKSFFINLFSPGL